MFGLFNVSQYWKRPIKINITSSNVFFFLSYPQSKTPKCSIHYDIRERKSTWRRVQSEKWEIIKIVERKWKHLYEMRSYSCSLSLKQMSPFRLLRNPAQFAMLLQSKIWLSINNLCKKKFKVANFWIITIAAVGVVVTVFLFLCLVGWYLLQANKLKWSLIRASLCISVVPSVFSICPLSTEAG